MLNHSKLAIHGGKPVRDSFLVFGNPLISEDEIAEVVAVLRSGWIGTGPQVARFQAEFAQYLEAHHAMALNSCTAALHLALLAAGVGPGDEVITTAMTFCATANAIIHSGATPIFADCERDTMNISPEQIRKHITPRTRAIVPVHFAGRPCDMRSILQIAREHNLKIIEDCAHAIETTLDGRHAGTFGDFGCFSFYVTKNVITGEGGMVVTQNEQDADRIRILGLHGMSRDAWKRFSDAGYRHYQVVAAGFKYNMMDLQAALGRRQLEKVERHWQRRAAVWMRYNEAFAGYPCFLPSPAPANTRHACHLYTPLLDLTRLNTTRDEVLTALTAENIGVGVHYLGLHRHPYYAESHGLRPLDVPNAEFISDRTLSLPLSAKLTDADVEHVITALKKVLDHFAR
jgi:dTDP-4-amino-4,6-dideoxygalactose transaminase